MDIQKIKDAIRLAKTAVENIDEPEKSIIFPVVLSELIRNQLQMAGSRKQEDNKNISVDEDFRGLTGGIRRLMKEGFFREGKSQGDIFEELKRQAYHYPKTSLPMTLRGFLGKDLTRYKGDDDQWRYVEKK